MRAATILAPIALAACFRNAGRTPPPTTPVVIAMSDDLHGACALPRDERGAPRFQYRSWALETGADRTLERLADCLTRGPLTGAVVRVVVRNNEPELAQKRSDAVKAYLVQLGVPRERVVETTLDEGAGITIERAQ